jgi:hypothetical protein
VAFEVEAVSFENGSELKRAYLVVAGKNGTDCGLLERLLLVGDAGYLCRGRNWKFDSADLFDYSCNPTSQPASRHR